MEFEFPEHKESNILLSRAITVLAREDMTPARDPKQFLLKMLARNWSETSLKRSVGPRRCIWTDFQPERTRFELFRDENCVLWLHCSDLLNLAGWITWMDGLDDLDGLP